MIKGLGCLALSWVVTLSVNATAHAITPNEAKDFLLYSPPHAMNKGVPSHYKNIEQLTAAMFSKDKTIRLGEGYRNYLTVKNQADLRNPYASYNVGLYQIINRETLKTNYSESLVYLKLASDGGIDDAMYSLALIYLNNTDQVANIINAGDIVKGGQYEKVIAEDKQKFKELGQQYILALAHKGHEKAFMTACNFFATGQYLEREITSAALCYNNAVKLFDSNIAKGLLAKIYFDVPEFDSIEFERLGIQLSKEAAAKGNVYAMVNLGERLIRPRHVPRDQVEAGVSLLRNAAAHGDDRAIALLNKYLGDDGVLRVSL